MGQDWGLWIKIGGYGVEIGTSGANIVGSRAVIGGS